MKEDTHVSTSVLTYCVVLLKNTFFSRILFKESVFKKKLFVPDYLFPPCIRERSELSSVILSNSAWLGKNRALKRFLGLALEEKEKLFFYFSMAHYKSIFLTFGIGWEGLHPLCIEPSSSEAYFSWNCAKTFLPTFWQPIFVELCYRVNRLFHLWLGAAW